MSVHSKKAKPISRKVNAAKPTFTGQARPKYIVPDTNVFEAAVERMRWLFDEFDNDITVSSSGGKDSTIVVELAALVANERGVKFDVWWLDQECEFASTVDYQRYLAYEREEINFRWYQIPFKLENATNLTDQYLNVWGPGEEWVRDKEPNSITENVYGEEYWYNLLASISSHDTTGCTIDGMRAEESPARRLLMMGTPMYKWTTWSSVDCAPGHERDPSWHRWRFHPIYDWSYRDVWKAIHEHGWRYNEHYNHLFQRGVPVKNMRVSNYHHDQALSSLHWLQEVEPDTWEAATRRLEGISTYGHLKGDQYPKSLPYMFASWEEYMVHLIENLIPDLDDNRATFYKQYERLKLSCHHQDSEILAQVIVKAVISGDYYGTQIKNYMVSNRPKKKVSQ